MFGTIIEHRVKVISLCDVRGTILSEFSHMHIHNFLDRNNVRLLAKTYQLTMYIAQVNFSVFRANNRGGNYARPHKFLLRSLSTLLRTRVPHSFKYSQKWFRRQGGGFFHVEIAKTLSF